jgi:hypothetical protein
VLDRQNVIGRCRRVLTPYDCYDILRIFGVIFVKVDAVRRGEVNRYVRERLQLAAYVIFVGVSREERKQGREIILLA